MRRLVMREKEECTVSPTSNGKRSCEVYKCLQCQKGSPFMRLSSNVRLEIRRVWKRRMHMYNAFLVRLAARVTRRS
jgi:hypothetical protein